MHTIHIHEHIAGREKNLNHIQDNIHTNHQAMDMLRNRNEITTRTIQSNIKRWTDDAIHHLKSMYNRFIDIAIYMLSLSFQCRRNDIYVFMIMAKKMLENHLTTGPKPSYTVIEVYKVSRNKNPM